ncbi:hypothetical protein GGQ19_000433 [Salinibacter ruber]|nr:hypothetical protein [Salinibacter ruber]
MRLYTHSTGDAPAVISEFDPPAEELFLTLYWGRLRPLPKSYARLDSAAQRIRPRGHTPPRRYHLVGHANLIDRANLIDHVGGPVQRDHYRRVYPMETSGDAHFEPLRRDFLRRNRNFSSDSCRICLCLATDQSATLSSAQRISEGVGPQRHLLAVEAKRQALRSAFLAKARPVLGVGGLLRRLARDPFWQKRQSALECAAARQESQIGRRDGASGLPPWPSGSDRERLLVALRVVSG